LISNYHVVKNATKVRLVTSAGLIDAKVVQVDAGNDLALLKADGRFAAAAHFIVWPTVMCHIHFCYAKADYHY